MIVYSVLETDAYHCTPRECVHDRRPPNTTFQCSYNLSSPVLGANSNVSRSTMEYLGGKNCIENCSAVPNTFSSLFLPLFSFCSLQPAMPACLNEEN